MYKPATDTDTTKRLEELLVIISHGDRAARLLEDVAPELRDLEKKIIEDLIEFNYQNIDNSKVKVLQLEVKMIRLILKAIERPIERGEQAEALAKSL